MTAGQILDWGQSLQQVYWQMRRLLTHSLRAQVALLVGSLSFLPNIVLIIASYWLDPVPVPLPSPWLWGIIIWIPLLGLLSAGIGYGSSYLMFRPLTLLAKELSQMEVFLDHPEQWSLTLKPKDPEEAMILRGAFSHLLQRVQTEQARRTAFTATLMHDLKTPLIAFGHLLHTLRDQDMPRPQQQDLLNQLLQENQRILELVQKMVEVHRFEQGEIKLHRQPSDLGALAQALVKRMQPLAQERQLQLQVRGEGWAEVDSSEISRALYNLLDNGIRYARHALEVEVTSHQIKVSDDGPGLPAALEELAQPYTAQPIEIAGKRYTAGSGGLGLFIARRILEAHGGSLAVEKTDAQGTILVMVISPAPDGAS
ncbi:MAG: HAMP domain-containing sensor histidine kinase [Cyanobacteriota bacterium]|nr:HAMP domain-containing sensor histidine kinase [Cyanobacteriota bacterium]